MGEVIPADQLPRLAAGVIAELELLGCTCATPAVRLERHGTIVDAHVTHPEPTCPAADAHRLLQRPQGFG